MRTLLTLLLSISLSSTALAGNSVYLEQIGTSTDTTVSIDIDGNNNSINLSMEGTGNELNFKQEGNNNAELHFAAERAFKCPTTTQIVQDCCQTFQISPKSEF